MPNASIAQSAHVSADHLQRKSGLEALLLVLPRDYDGGALSDDDADKLRAVEALLFGSRSTLPVFFAQETPELQQAVGCQCDLAINILCLSSNLVGGKIGNSDMAALTLSVAKYI